MAVSKIQYDNKEQMTNIPTIPAKNKCTADDLNEIKTVVNNNADILSDTETLLNNRANYSSNETVIGIWEDGKTLYRKILSRSGAGDIDISSLGVDTIMIDYTHSYLYVSSLGRYAPLNYTSIAATDVGKYQTSCFINSSKTAIKIECGASLTLGYVQVVIEYTKD